MGLPCAESRAWEGSAHAAVLRSVVYSYSARGRLTMTKQAGRTCRIMEDAWWAIMALACMHEARTRLSYKGWGNVLFQRLDEGTMPKFDVEAAPAYMRNYICSWSVQIVKIE